MARHGRQARGRGHARCGVRSLRSRARRIRRHLARAHDERRQRRRQMVVRGRKDHRTRTFGRRGARRRKPHRRHGKSSRSRCSGRLRPRQDRRRRAASVDHPPAGATTVDVSGKTIVPGLWDMHAHFQQVEHGAAYLASGVTTVRDLGNILEFVTGIRDAIDAGSGSARASSPVAWSTAKASERRGPSSSNRTPTSSPFSND